MVTKDSSARVCKQCVLPDTFPGIYFDSSGVCNYCLEQKNKESRNDNKAEYRSKFEALVRKHKGNSVYDVLVCYSGGKDSTYTVAALKEDYGLNLLAVSLDNGFISNQAVSNIKMVVEKLGIDHVFLKPRYDILSKVFRCCAEKDIFAPKTLEKASSICTACMAFVKYGTLRIALEKDIPLIAYGWSPGQAPITSSIIKNNPRMVKFMQKSLYDPLYKVLGEEVRPYFLEDKHFKNKYRFPYYVHPLAFLDYDEEEIYRNIERFAWKSPEDVDANSTNCLLNSFGNLVHKQRLGFHPYAYELANLVRDGYLDRDTALTRLSQQENPEILATVRTKLAIIEDS